MKAELTEITNWKPPTFKDKCVDVFGTCVVIFFLFVAIVVFVAATGNFGKYGYKANEDAAMCNACAGCTP